MKNKAGKGSLTTNPSMGRKKNQNISGDFYETHLTNCESLQGVTWLNVGVPKPQGNSKRILIVQRENSKSSTRGDHVFLEGPVCYIPWFHHSLDSEYTICTFLLCTPSSHARLAQIQDYSLFAVAGFFTVPTKFSGAKEIAQWKVLAPQAQGHKFRSLEPK